MSGSAHTREYKLFRELLRTTRIEAGLTQVDVARSMGRPQSYVSKYETGERRLDVVELLAVCAALQLPVTRFVKRLETRLRR
jgi:transcriptional regulator with XRE-family HTH domain